MQKRHLFGWLCLLLLIILAIAVVLNREWLYDFYRGVSYQPSSEMAQIRNSLQLTDRGEFLFNAAQPELSGAAEFNSYCRNGESEIAVLGCYTAGNIYVYNITDQRLNGIRELTSAHELLHVNWARMSDDEKTSLVEPLTRTFEANQDFLSEEINNYNTDEKQEELYVRAGTEVANLPDVLEQHYAKIFKDQDAIVAYYNSYISVFRTLQAEMDSLKSEMGNIKSEIDSKTNEYEQRSAQLNADITSFNNCAEKAGCFTSEYDFYARRDELVTEQTALETIYNEINNLISTYNAKVESYNADVLESEKLNTIINSAAQPQEIKSTSQSQKSSQGTNEQQ